MVDSIAPLSGTTGPFDTAAMQIALARAHAAAAHTNQVTFLQETAKTNSEANAQALVSTAAAPTANAFLDNGLSNQDLPADTAIDPVTNPSAIFLPLEFGSNLTNAPTDASIEAQRLHDVAVLQKDAMLLEEAANADNHLPLGSGASTVDLSLEAQRIVDGTTIASINGSAPPTPPQLTQTGNIFQPIANEPLTSTLLQQIQAQLNAAQNPIGLSLNNIFLIISFMGSAQLNPHHAIETIAIPDNSEVVAPVSAIDKVAVEDSAIRG